VERTPTRLDSYSLGWICGSGCGKTAWGDAARNFNFGYAINISKCNILMAEMRAIAPIFISNSFP